MDFKPRKGAVAAKEASSGPSRNIRFFGSEGGVNLEKDGDSCILRLLTEFDDWIVIGQHLFVPTKGAPKGHTGKWPKAMGAVCRNDEAFLRRTDAGEILDGSFFPDYGECYICATDMGQTKYGGAINAVKIRVWALAVVREYADDSKTTIRDQMVEVEVDGKKRKVPNIVVVNQSYATFFGQFDGARLTYGTVCDRDYRVTLVDPGSKDKAYRPMPLDRDTSLMPGTEAWGRYEEEIKRQNLNLGKIIQDMASKAHYERWFIPSAEEGGPDDSGQVVKDSEGMAALRERVKQHASVGSSQQ